MKSVACSECPLRRLSAFANNQPEELAFIQAFRSAQVKREAGGAIVEEGRKGGELFTVFSGWAFRYRTLSDGRRQILNFLLPGDFVGLQEQMAAQSGYGVEALTDVILCVFPPEKLWDLYRNFPGLAYDVTWLCAHEELIVDENLVTVGQRSAAERIAMLLIHLYKRVGSLGQGGEDGVPFPVTQQHIADALGLSLVHTNKTMRKLAQAGYFEISRGRLKLGDLHAMQRLADYHGLPLRGRPLI